MHSVLDYGAAGDGVADDTAAFIAAALVADASRGVVYVPSWTYRTTEPLTVNPRRVSIVGDGPQCSVIMPELDPGEFALTLDGNASDRPGPYNALQGIGFEGVVGEGQPGGLRIGGTGGSGLTIRDVSIRGFDTQVSFGNNSYITLFDRVFFRDAWTYGVDLNNPSPAGENLTFTHCVWSDGPSTGIHANRTGASIHLAHCSFDYMKRAVWQRAGHLVATACHFEAGTQYAQAGAEYILLARNGQVNLPMMNLTDCTFYDGWVGYDCAIRLDGEFGTNGLRVTNPYVVRAQTNAPYFIRDDGTYPSSVVVDGAWYGRGDFPTPKMRRHNGTDLTLTHTVRHEV